MTGGARDAAKQHLVIRLISLLHFFLFSVSFISFRLSPKRFIFFPLKRKENWNYIFWFFTSLSLFITLSLIRLSHIFVVVIRVSNLHTELIYILGRRHFVFTSAELV